MSPDGVRLTTLEVTFPRIVLAEFNTHRMFSRNSASSRAIPVEKMIQRVMDDPFVPVWWGKNQKGMQAAEELSDLDPPDGDGLRFGSPRAKSKLEWLHARNNAVESVRSLQAYDLHKQIANRLLEPWLWHTVIVTATEWANFFALRRHKDAQPEIRVAADMMWDAREASSPEALGDKVWHMPLVDPVEVTASWGQKPDWLDYWKKVSVGRCTRVSYLTHDGKRDPDEDVALCERIRKAGHMSPFEHVARPMRLGDPWFPFGGGGPVLHLKDAFAGNFRGWIQMRKELPNEAVFKGEEAK
jgi:thymidylate synthase ThyX